ncbi:prepilin signal peptidase PulO-like peptidase [Idiomarina sp. A28L]|uniref:prepilin peptidase n=1 Tax=Idiomarina sp. A28L TaxID=1036674 RepID=UPI000213879A|nr:A24 family peptidase [Idiomarina sp. A28L]EGN74826.1 prepilin signal peptidase PulO-like peptidase [Idiomarina sp. A28L]
MAEIFQVFPWVGFVFAALFGLVFGSFGNVIVARLPRMLEQQWRDECAASFPQIAHDPKTTKSSSKRFNLAYPASHCPKCGHSLRWFENIPLLSYLIQKGRCRSCKTHISLRYPITEAVSALLTLAAVAHFGFTYQAIAFAVLLYVLLLLTLIDSEIMLLPDQLTLPLLWLGLILSIHILPVSPTDAIIGGAAGYLFLWSVYWLFKLATGKEGMGYGDFKLLAVLGVWLGWQALPIIVLLSSLVGAAYGIFMIILRKHSQDKPMPFGPFLAVAGGIALFYAEPIYLWYWNFAL